MPSPRREFGQVPTWLMGRVDGLALALYAALHANSDLATLHGEASRRELMRDAGIPDTTAYYRRRRVLEGVGAVRFEPSLGGRAVTSWTLIPAQGTLVGSQQAARRDANGEPVVMPTATPSGSGRAGGRDANGEPVGIPTATPSGSGQPPRRDPPTTREGERGERAETPHLQRGREAVARLRLNPDQAPAEVWRRLDQLLEDGWSVEDVVAEVRVRDGGQGPVHSARWPWRVLQLRLDALAALIPPTARAEESPALRGGDGTGVGTLAREVEQLRAEAFAAALAELDDQARDELREKALAAAHEAGVAEGHELPFVHAWTREHLLTAKGCTEDVLQARARDRLAAQGITSEGGSDATDSE